MEIYDDRSEDVWVTKDGERIRVDDLTEQHMRRIIRSIVRHRLEVEKATLLFSARLTSAYMADLLKDL